MNDGAKSAPAGRREELAARAYFDYAVTGMLETDGAWHIGRANPAAASLTGRERGRLAGLSLAEALGVQEPARIGRHLALLAEQGIHQSEMAARRADGAPIVITLSSVQAGEDFFVHVFDDVTAERNARAELEAARAEAVAANRAKGEFLANVSHEIRTPLNGIIGLARIVLDGALEAQQRAHVDDLLRSGTHLLRIVNDLLDSAKLDAGRMDFEDAPYAPAEVLAELESLRAQVPPGRPVTLSIERSPDLPPWVLGDRLRVTQCLTNLVGNALKFTAAGRVTLAAGIDPDAPGMLRFVVADTGCGIAPEALARLFAPFSQADGSTARRYGGTGLGLHIARAMARGMGGDLCAESTAGVGSRFTLTLPLRPAQAPDFAPPALADAGVPDEFRGRHLLVAEDNPVNQTVILHWLRRAGIRCSVAGDGAAALALLEQESDPPDLVLMDVQMPGVDGLEATRQLRARGFTGPVVGLSAGASRPEQEACFAAGMSDFLPKPVDLDELWGCLTRWLPPDASTSAASQGEESVEARFLGDAAMLAQARAAFRAGHGQDALRLEELLGRAETEQAARVAHALKGAAATLGLAELARLADTLESACLRGDLAASGAACAAIDGEMRRALDTLAAEPGA